jgi:hypothetical protein
VAAIVVYKRKKCHGGVPFGFTSKCLSPLEWNHRRPVDEKNYMYPPVNIVFFQKFFHPLGHWWFHTRGERYLHANWCCNIYSLWYTSQVGGSPALLSMWPCINVPHPGYLLLSNSTHKTKTLFANRWKTTNSKAPGPIIMIANPKQGVSIRSYLLHSSLAGVRLCCVFYQPAKLCKNGEPKPFCGACFDFSSSNFNLQGQILVLSAIIFQNTHTHTMY